MISNDKIFLSNVVAMVQMAMGYDGNSRDVEIRSLLWLAIRQLMPVSDWLIKTVEIELHGCRVEKPCDWVAPVRIELLGNGCCVYPTYRGQGDVSCNSGCNCDCSITVEDTNCYLHFSSGTSKRFEKVRLVYQSHGEMDGEYRVFEAHALALSKYAQWNLLLAERRKQIRNKRQGSIISLQDIEIAKRDWEQERKALKTKNNMPNLMQVHQAGISWSQE